MQLAAACCKSAYFSVYFRITHPRYEGEAIDTGCRSSALAASACWLSLSNVASWTIGCLCLPLRWKTDIHRSCPYWLYRPLPTGLSNAWFPVYTRSQISQVAIKILYCRDENWRRNWELANMIHSGTSEIGTTVRSTSLLLLTSEQDSVLVAEFFLPLEIDEMCGVGTAQLGKLETVLL